MTVTAAYNIRYFTRVSHTHSQSPIRAHFSLHKNRRRFSFTVMASAKKKVLVPIANGTEPLEAVVITDVLRRAGADVTVASVEKQLQVDASHGVKIVADALISDCAETVFDLISLPGGLSGAATLKNCKTLENMVKKQAAENRLCAAICAAPAIAFGPWDLLKGRKATCYPSFMEQLPSTATASVSRVEKDDKVVTSQGPGTTIEYAIALVEQLFGKEKAEEVSGPLIVRSNHGEEYAFADLNPVSWTYDGSPQTSEYRQAPFKNYKERVANVTQGSARRAPRSPWISIPDLFAAISNEIPEKVMNGVKSTYESYKSEKITRDGFVRNLRLLVGDPLLRAMLTKYQCKVPSKAEIEQMEQKPRPEALQ